MNKLDFYLKEYLKERPMFLGLIRAKEAELYQRFRPLGEPILDIGVGDGFFAKIAFCSSSKCKVQSAKLQIKHQKLEEEMIDVGLDLLESRMGEAGKWGVYRKLVVFDGRKIPFPDQSFETVISNCVLEHVEDLEGLLEEIYRVLTPQGRFLTTVVTKNWEEYFFGNLIFGNLYKRWMRKKQVHVNMLTEEEWETRFEKTGFKIQEEIGYLERKAVGFIDLAHYLSLGSLISYKLIGRWVIFPDKPIWPPLRWLVKLIEPEVAPDKSGNIFFALKKRN